jgi:hypothetical protein
MDEAEVVLQVETCGSDHSEKVIRVLRSAGYSLAFG